MTFLHSFLFVGGLTAPPTLERQEMHINICSFLVVRSAFIWFFYFLKSLRKWERERKYVYGKRHREEIGKKTKLKARQELKNGYRKTLKYKRVLMFLRETLQVQFISRKNNMGAAG